MSQFLHQLIYDSPDIEVRRKAVNIVLAMVNGRNVEDIVKFFEKQLQRTMTEDYEKVCAIIIVW